MTGALSPDTLLAVIETESGRLADAVRSAPTAAVASCPGWDNTALAAHMADVFQFARAQVEAADPSAMAGPEKIPADGELDRFEQATAQLLGSLRAAGPAAPSWSWAGIDDTSFYFRRMAHEVTVHRVDAQRAAGASVDPIDGVVAADGIDEVIEVGMQHRIRGASGDFPTGSLHLHRTDGDGEWMLVAEDGRLVVTHEHAKGDAAARGPAQDLLLFLWGRGRGALEVFGDETVADAWAGAGP